MFPVIRDPKGKAILLGCSNAIHLPRRRRSDRLVRLTVAGFIGLGAILLVFSLR